MRQSGCKAVTRPAMTAPAQQDVCVGPYRLAVWAQPNAQTVIYLHPGSNDIFAAAAQLFPRAKERVVSPFALVSIDGVDWNRDLSPWPAPKIFLSGNAFSGGADAYLNTFLSEILPVAEALLDAPPAVRALAGYSMGGLFALYAMYKVDWFGRFASMSGSLWYDGFSDYMESHAPAGKPERVYLSLGSAEKRTNNARLATVENCTLQAKARLTALGVPTVYEAQPGGHSADVPKRLVDGLLSLL